MGFEELKELFTPTTSIKVKLPNKKSVGLLLKKPTAIDYNEAYDYAQRVTIEKKLNPEFSKAIHQMVESKSIEEIKEELSQIDLADEALKELERLKSEEKYKDIDLIQQELPKIKDFKAKENAEKLIDEFNKEYLNRITALKESYLSSTKLIKEADLRNQYEKKLLNLERLSLLTDHIYLYLIHKCVVDENRKPIFSLAEVFELDQDVFVQLKEKLISLLEVGPSKKK